MLPDHSTQEALKKVLIRKGEEREVHTQWRPHLNGKQMGRLRVRS
jgi:hypothetical protein